MLRCREKVGSTGAQMTLIMQNLSVELRRNIELDKLVIAEAKARQQATAFHCFQSIVRPVCMS